MTFIITRGAPASGKSTFARAFVAQSPNTRVEVNRDNIRATMGITYVGTPQEEIAVTNIAHTMIATALDAGKDVVVSDMNLHDFTVKKLLAVAFAHGVTPDQVFIRVFDVDKKTLLERNNKRPDAGRVPYSVLSDAYERMVHIARHNKEPRLISKMWEEHKWAITPYTNNKDLKPCIVVDVDGTLAHRSPERSPYSVNADLLWDAPDTAVIDAVRAAQAQGKAIIVVSGRNEQARPWTKQWLNNHNIPFDELHMRPDGDNQADWIIKHQIIDSLTKRFYIAYCLDDRDQVVDHNRAAGLKVFQVQSGNF